MISSIFFSASSSFRSFAASNILWRCFLWYYWPCLRKWLHFSLHKSNLALTSSMESSSGFSMLHLLAYLFKLPLFRILPEWYHKRERYTCALQIQMEASGENGILPDLIRLHFFSALFIYCWLSRSILSNFFSFFLGVALTDVLQAFFPSTYISWCFFPRSEF